MESYKAKLLKRRDELSARLRRIEDDLDAPRSADGDERAIKGDDEEVLEALGEAGASELRAVDAALGRIDERTFGLCAKCGKPISKNRLNAVPHAALCMDCIAESHVA